MVTLCLNASLAMACGSLRFGRNRGCDGRSHLGTPDNVAGGPVGLHVRSIALYINVG
jgi:hypothetical protein